MLRIKRSFGDTLLSLAALTALLAVLASVNERVRHEVTRRLTIDQARTDLARAAADVSDLAGVVADVARYQTIEHAPLAIFVLGACVLVVFMLRV